MCIYKVYIDREKGYTLTGRRVQFYLLDDCTAAKSSLTKIDRRRFRRQHTRGSFSLSVGSRSHPPLLTR